MSKYLPAVNALPTCSCLLFLPALAVSNNSSVKVKLRSVRCPGGRFYFTEIPFGTCFVLSFLAAVKWLTMLRVNSWLLRRSFVTHKTADWLLKRSFVTHKTADWLRDTVILYYFDYTTTYSLNYAAFWHQLRSLRENPSSSTQGHVSRPQQLSLSFTLQLFNSFLFPLFTHSRK